jgi:hypothetical protein
VTRKSVTRKSLFSGAALGAAFLAASCGGGGGGSAPPPPPTPVALLCATPGPTFSTYADASVPVGKAAGAMVAGCTGPLTNLRWTQTEGAAVTLVAPGNQAISFTPSAPGTYSFRVDFVDAAGTAQSTTVSTAVTAATASSPLSSYSDQAVRQGGNVSLRAWPTLAAGETQVWTQLDGPTVTLDASDPNRVLFTAPAVSVDTGLRFGVTRTRVGGAVETEDVLVLVERHAQAPAGTDAYVFSDDHVSRVYPYRSNGPYAAQLVRCVYDAQLQWSGAGKNLCPLTTLPFLHQDSGGGVPSIEQVMNRVLVSHDWMGQVFEQFLQANDASGDIRRLLNGVTAIIIGAHVRPSFYFALTGAIYLDADNFWLTPEQRDVIDETPDFRSDFDRDLGYGALWRYALNNQSIFAAFPLSSRISRDVPYLQFEAGWLMYHELGHASDFMPVAARTALNANLSAWDTIAPRFINHQLVSDVLTTQSPLLSEEMRALAQVKFVVGPPTNPSAPINGFTYSTLTAWTPQQVAGFLSPDRAGDEYNYTTPREDLAMLFEEFMMFRNLAARRDVAITDKITASSTGSSIIVRWGQRGRAGEAAVRTRTRFAVEQLAPWVNLAEVDALPAPIAMRAGESWTANLSLPAPPPVVRAQAAMTERERAAEVDLVRQALRRPGTPPRLRAAR